MKTTTLTGAQAILKYLANQLLTFDGEHHKLIHNIAAVLTPHNAVPMGEALHHQSSDFHCIQFDSEQAMLYAAAAYTKQKNRLQTLACIGTSTQCVSGATFATVNRLPILLLISDDALLTNTHLHDCLKPASRYFALIQHGAQLVTDLPNAIQTLVDPIKTGAVTLVLPQTVLTQAHTFDSAFFEKKIWAIERQTADKSAIESAAQMIQTAKQPLLIAGGGIQYAFATEQLTHFSHAHAIPVCETHAGRSSMHGTDPLNVGSLGADGSLVANQLAKEADVIIIVGATLQATIPNNITLFTQKNCQIIYLDIACMNDKTQPGHFIQADAKLGLIALSKALLQYHTSARYQQKIHKLKAHWQTEMQKRLHKHPSSELTSTKIIQAIHDTLAKEDVVIGAASNMAQQLMQCWQSKGIKDCQITDNAGLGYEIAAGLGNKLANPNHNVAVLVNNKSFLVDHTALLTAKRESIKLIIILIDTIGIPEIEQQQIVCGLSSIVNTYNHQHDDDENTIQFVPYCHALGIAARLVNTITEFQAALREAKHALQTTVICLRLEKSFDLLPNAYWQYHAIPEVSKHKHAVKTHKAMQKMLAKLQKNKK